MFNLFKKKKVNKPVKDEAYYRSYDAYEEEEDIYFEKRNNQKARVFLVMGPTCSGKTKVSIEIAKKFNAEIINADKEQMYKHLNIGTAKVTKEEMKGIKHHLIDFLDLRNNYTVRDYQRDGRKILDELLDQGKNVVVVGGSGLYIKALLFDYRFPEEDPEFYPECENFGNGYLKMKATQFEPFTEVHVNNRCRLERIFTRVFASKERIYNNCGKNLPLYDIDYIELCPEREELYDRINKRVDKMFKSGLVEEVKKYKRYPKLKTIIGYKETLQYLKNEITLEECKTLIKRNTRHYAKRQMTWFRTQFMESASYSVDYKHFNYTIERILRCLGPLNKK